MAGKLDKPSDEFLAALHDSSSLVSSCEFCGRTYFVDNENEDWDEGELEGLRENARKNPDKYIATDEWVERGILNGKEYVLGCSCNGARVYENFIWDNRELISKYISSRAKKEQREADENSRLARNIRESNL